MRTPAERLVKAREDAGCETAAEAAERAGVKYYTYVQHESGTRGISKDKAAVYGRAFGVDTSWLLYGKGRAKDASQGEVRILGKVGADPEGTIIQTDAQDVGDMAPPPPGGTSDSVAVEVQGNSMHGIADDGALVYFEIQRRPPTEDMIGYEAVVETEDGRVLFKRLLRGKEQGLFDLQSINGETIRDVRLKWAAEPTAIIPPKQARRIIRRGGE